MNQKAQQNFAITVFAACATPIAFFALVPERLIEKLFNLDWLTILAVGVPAILAAATAVRQAWMGSVAAPSADRKQGPQ